MGTRARPGFQDSSDKDEGALSALRVNDPPIFFTDEGLRKQGVDLRHRLFARLQEIRESRGAVFLDHLSGKFSYHEKWRSAPILQRGRG